VFDRTSMMMMLDRLSFGDLPIPVLLLNMSPARL